MKLYRKKHLQPMEPWTPETDMTNVSVSPDDARLPTLEGGMIAHNPDNLDDRWYVSKQFFEDNYEEA